MSFCMRHVALRICLGRGNIIIIIQLFDENQEKIKIRKRTGRNFDIKGGENNLC